MNRLCDALGIDHPIIQSGMGGVAGPDLAAAVCRAGGLGILAALMLPPDVLRDQIGALRSQVDGAFGVNIWLHSELQPPQRPGDLDRALVDRVQHTLDDIRSAHDLPSVDGPPHELPDLVASALDVMIEQRIPVFSAGVGLPSRDLVGRFHDVGSRVVTMVTDVEDAVEAVARGADVIVAQGSEAGGHRSVGTKRPRSDVGGSSTFVLVPAVRDAIGPEVPLAAAGGIADGRGIAAAMALGADGVLLGTRFVATRESAAAGVWKQALLDHDRPTVLTDSLSGQWARALRNDYVERYDAASPGTLPSLLQASAAGDIFAAGRDRADADMMPLWAGDVALLIDDLPPVAQVMERLVADAERVLGRPLA